MDKKKLNKLKRRLEDMRGRVSNLTAQELVSLAKALGRTRSKRGKEPTYISELLPQSKPISIPYHPGSLNKFTAGNILDALEHDIFSLEEKLGD